MCYPNGSGNRALDPVAYIIGKALFKLSDKHTVGTQYKGGGMDGRLGNVSGYEAAVRIVIVGQHIGFKKNIYEKSGFDNFLTNYYSYL